MKKYLILIISFFAAIACQNEILDSTCNNHAKINVTASLPATTRTTLINNGNTTQTHWNEGDVISLSTSDKTYEYIISSTNGTDATFEPVNEYNVLVAEEGETIHAYHGCYKNYDKWVTYNSHLPLIAVGKVTDNELSLQFTHMLSFLKLKLTGDAFPESEKPTLWNVSLTSNSQLFSEYMVVDSTTYTLKPEVCEGASSFNIYTDYIDLNKDSWESDYIPVLPHIESQVSIYINNKIHTVRNTPNGGFEPGHVYTLSPDNDGFLISVELEKSVYNVGFEGGTINTTLTTNSKLEIEADVLGDATEWLQVMKTRSENRHSYTISYKKNTTVSPREGLIVFTANHYEEYIGKTCLACDTLRIIQKPLSGNKTVHVNMSGELHNILKETEKDNITDLTITGIIDYKQDIGYINTMSNLVRLDLSNVYVVAHTGLLDDFQSNMPAQTFYGSASTSTLKTLILPKSLVMLGNEALPFHNLDTLVFHNKIQEIGERNRLGKKTFISNENLNYMAKFNTGVEDLYIDDLRAYCETNFGAEDIYDICSGGGFQPKRIYLDNELLTDLVIPEYINEIQNNAFQGVESITSVTLAEETTHIGPWAFKDCINLKSIKNYGNIRAIGKGAFINTAISEFHIPENMTELNGDLFNNCRNLSVVTLHDRVNTIGCMAFYNCQSLKELKIPDSVTIIEAGAFRNCTNLKSVGNLDNVKFLYQYAFMNCSSLESVSFRDLEDMGAGAFIGCESLKKVYINNLRLWCHMIWCHLITSRYNSWWQNWDNDWDKTSPLYYADELYINNVLTTDLILPDDVDNIGNRAFCGFEGLTSVNIKNVSQLQMSFKGCTNLKEVITTRSKPATLPMYDAFDSSIRSTCTLKVPEGSLEAYKDSRWADYFTNIIEY